MFSKKMVSALAIIVLFVFTAVLLPASARHGPRAHPIGGIVFSVIAPVQEGVTRLTGFAVFVWETYFNLVSTSRVNRQLEKDLATARQNANRHREIERENERLRDLLGFARQSRRKVVTALVVAEDPAVWFDAIFINQGTADGVRKGLAVTTPTGIVGKIINAGPNYSQVLLITDRNSAMGARAARTRVRGILEGGHSGQCCFKYVQQKRDVAAGDEIITTGMDRVFPPGLAVGVVTKVIRDPQGMFQEIIVEPHVDFDKLEEVLVILGTDSVLEMDLQ